MIKNLIAILLFPVISFAQRVDVDLFGGMSNYQGDLQEHVFTFTNANASAAINIKYELTDKIFIRSGFSFGSLAAFDADNKAKNVPRNLNFRTALQEYSLGLEYHFVNLEAGRLSPYVFAGGGVFHYNPYTYHNTSAGVEKVYLQPLGTEGQGLSQYPDRKPYKLTQFCIPYGVGIKYQLTCNLNVGFEFRHTKTFTDYIDDVSKTYVNQDALRAAHGQVAVDLAWRQDEYNGSPYPATDKPRGNPGQADLYYFAGLTVGLRFNDCSSGNFSLGGLFNGEKSLFHRAGGGYPGSRRIRNQVGCPKF